MNIYQIVKEGKTEKKGCVYCFTILFPQAYWKGFDNRGRAIKEFREQSQVFFAVNKKTAEQRAIEYLKNIQRENKIMTKYRSLGVIRIENLKGGVKR